MFLFFDKETTGLPDYNLDLTDPKQPHTVQLALVLANEDGREMAATKIPIKPDGRFAVDEGGRAYEVNKLGNKDLEDFGFPLAIALRLFRMYQDRAILKVAHNYRFDGFIMKCEHARLGVDPGPVIDKFCTMKAMQDFTKTATGPKPKSGKLVDCYEFVTGKPLDNAHDALADVRACKDVFFWIKSQGLYKPQPRVVPAGAAA